jgi:hypothetical protein
LIRSCSHTISDTAARIVSFLFAFGRMILVVPFTLVLEGQWLSQDLSLREIRQHLATIFMVAPVVMLPAMMKGTHSKVLVAH